MFKCVISFNRWQNSAKSKENFVDYLRIKFYFNCPLPSDYKINQTFLLFSTFYKLCKKSVQHRAEPAAGRDNPYKRFLQKFQKRYVIELNPKSDINIKKRFKKENWIESLLSTSNSVLLICINVFEWNFLHNLLALNKVCCFQDSQQIFWFLTERSENQPNTGKQCSGANWGRFELCFLHLKKCLPKPPKTFWSSNWSIASQRTNFCRRIYQILISVAWQT